MRMSCNGCRVLRKGCSDNCSIRPCLQWIKSSDSQAHATVFLAKFYGRAGLMNLINAGPEHLRPGIFRSLLYEACGRIVNPIYGSVGLMWSGSWHLCQAAVEAVLNGSPIVEISSDAAASNPAPPFKAYDIRHVPKDQHDIDPAAGPAAELHKVAKGTRSRFKRSAPKSHNIEVSQIDWLGNLSSQPANSHSHESLGSREAAAGSGKCDGESKENDSMVSMETMEVSHVSQGEISNNESQLEVRDIDLALTLGWGSPVATEAPAPGFSDNSGLDAILDAKVSLGLELRA